MPWIKQKLKSSTKTDVQIFLCELFLDSFGCPSLALATNHRLIRSCQIQSLAISFFKLSTVLEITPLAAKL